MSIFSSLLKGLNASKANKSQARWAAHYNRLAQEQQDAQLAKTEARFQPFLDSGKQAQSAFNAAMGWGGPMTGSSDMAGTQSVDPMAGFEASAYGKMFADPNIMESVNAGYSAKGMGLDGSAIASAYKRMNADKYGRFGDYMGAVNSGIGNALSAAGSTGQFGQNNAFANTNLLTNTGQSQGQMRVNNANIWNGTIDNVENSLGQAFQMVAGRPAMGQSSFSRWGG